MALTNLLPQTMKAAVFNRPESITLENIPVNQTNDGSIVLKTLACAVCGYDVRVYNQGHAKVHPPIILGHEICAETMTPIRAGGNGGKTIPQGTRVAVLPLVPCLKCYYCNNEQYNLCNTLFEIGSSLNGGFAEFIKIPLNNILINGLVPVPGNISNEEAALIEPLACCLNAHARFSSIDYDRNVIIIGDGPIGMLHLQISKLFGARTIIVGKIPSRVELAKEIGTDLAVLNDSVENTRRVIMDSTNGVGGNMIIVATSNPEVLDLTLSVASKESKIILFAGMPKSKILNIDPNWIHYNQISIFGSFSATPDLIREAARLISQNKIDVKKVITNNYYSLVDIRDAFIATEKYSGFRSVIHPSC
ncbi:MAG TPA: alcohol dehydrogenase catalytic domain-containing protein [Nitrososphaeraceae archaeon]|jgi:L-iditol 2-dehydrogenase